MMVVDGGEKFPLLEREALVLVLVSSYSCYYYYCCCCCYYYYYCYYYCYYHFYPTHLNSTLDNRSLTK